MIARAFLRELVVHHCVSCPGHHSRHARSHASAALRRVCERARPMATKRSATTTSSTSNQDDHRETREDKGKERTARKRGHVALAALHPRLCCECRRTMRAPPPSGCWTPHNRRRQKGKREGRQAQQGHKSELPSPPCSRAPATGTGDQLAPCRMCRKCGMCHAQAAQAARRYGSAGNSVPNAPRFSSANAARSASLVSEAYVSRSCVCVHTRTRVREHAGCADESRRQRQQGCEAREEEKIA